MQLSVLPSRWVAFCALACLLVLPFLFGTTRQRLYPSGSRPQPVKEQFVPNLDQRLDVHSLPVDEDFNHTSFFHVPADAQLPDHCQAVGADHVHNVARRNQVRQPLAYHFHKATPVDQINGKFAVGSGFCTIFLVPQVPWTKAEGVFKPTPIEGIGPDAIVAEMASADIKLVFSNSPTFWGTINSETDPTDLAVYAVSYVLNHPGDYKLAASTELPHYDWAMEDPINLVFKVPQDLIDAKDLSYSETRATVVSFPPAITISGKPVPRPSQPCYRNGFNDLRGRWYRAAGFAVNGQQTKLNAKARLDFAEQASTRDEFGWTFAPDLCSLTFFDAQDHSSCFGGKALQFLGDSNLRRLAKTVVSGGDKWCLTKPSDTTCECKDSEEAVLADSEMKEFDVSRFVKVLDRRSEPIPWGRNSKLYFDFVGGLLNPHWKNDWQLYFNGTDVDASVAASNPGMHLISQRQLQHGPIDVVLISMIVWDVVAIRTPAETLAVLPEFRRLLFAAYPPSTRFVMRLSNSVCCGTQGRRQRFSAPRFQMFNTMWREFWARDYLAGKILFYDASLLSGRADVAEAIPCGAPHLSCGAVRLEQQIFMNTVCEKPHGGAARLRDWSDRSHLPA